MGDVRVLLVDSSPEFLDAAAHFLTEVSGCVVVGQLRSTQETVGQVLALRPDVVLLELDMPLMSGLLATLHLKALPNPPRVVIVTNRTEGPYRSLAQAVQVDGFIPKPSFCAEVVPLIRHLAALQEQPAPNA